MIVLVEQGSERMVFDNVTDIKETTKSSVFSDAGRRVINLYEGDTMLMGGDDIDLMSTRITVLPNAEREP